MGTDNYDEPYPLKKTTEADLRALSQALWDWHDCPAATGSASSCGETCPWSRFGKLVHFHAFYKRLAASYVPSMEYGYAPALRCHSDLFDIVKCLKEQPDESRTQLISQYFGARHNTNTPKPPPPEDQIRAFSLAAQVVTMVRCSDESVDIAVLELSTQPIPWPGEMSISQFLLSAFPLASPLSLASPRRTKEILDARSLLSAEAIVKIGQLRLQPTDDIRSHLSLDAKAGTVRIYQHMSVLNEHLRATKGLSDQATIADTIRVGNMPRQLALEVLDSIHTIIFPAWSKSHDMLQDLVAKGTFNQDMLQLAARDIRRHKDESEGEYRYLASKLRDLLEEVKNPTPRGRFQQWFERRVAQRYFMMATIGGLLVAIILGVLSLGVGIFQAWLAYMAWKFPATSDAATSSAPTSSAS